MSVGWYDEEHTLEIRRLRPVQPRAAIKVCTKMFGRPMVLNCVADIMAFFVYGGQAVVREDICKKYFPTPPFFLARECGKKYSFSII